MTPPNPHPDHPAMSEQVRGGVENPSAFPNPDVRTHDGFGISEGSPGMTLRDWFAGQALNATIEAVLDTSPPGKPHETIAMLVYQLADAMLATRAQVQA